MLGEGINHRAGDDEMIEHTHINQIQGLLELACQAQISLARVRRPGWVVMSKDNCSRIVSECLLYNFSGINRSLHQGSAKQFFRANETVLGVQK